MGDLHSSLNVKRTNIRAVIFDLDGTLLNTEQGSKDILKNFLVRYGKVPDEEKENKRFGVTQKEAVSAIINDYDLPLTLDQFIEAITPLYHAVWSKAKALPGVNRLMDHLYKHRVPFALASNSLRKNIDMKISHQQGWNKYFFAIFGSDQVKAGKPSPDMFLEAAKRMSVDPAHCLVIEDSIVGVKAGKAAEMNVVAVPSLQIGIDQYSIADSVLHSLLNFEPELWGLPPFEDWVYNALPIEPIYLRGEYRNGNFHEHSDDELSLPDQVQGLYFGWARLDTHKIIKIVINVGWEPSCCSSRRTIQACVVDGSIDQQYDKEMELLIVGYIRGPSYMGNGFENLEMVEEDKLIAAAALNLPVFLSGTCKSYFPQLNVEDHTAAD